MKMLHGILGKKQQINNVMNQTNPTHLSSLKSQVWPRLLSFTGKLGACLLLLLGLAMLSQTARAQDGTTGFATAVLADQPLAFWQLNEDNNTLPAVDSSGNGYNATYGAGSLVGYASSVYSPQPANGIPGTPFDSYYQGFTNYQGAAQIATATANSPITLPHLNLNTNTVTFCMWINPAGGQANATGLLGNRTLAGDAAVVGFNANPVNGMPCLGYTWNTNSGATYNWNSQLYPQVGIWSFVAYVINTNGATVYLYYVDTNGNAQLQSAFNNVPSDPESFESGGTYLGSDSVQAGNAPNNIFNGNISSAAVFTQALGSQQILALFAAGQGVAGYAPQITVQPQSQYVFAGNTVNLSAVGVSGTQPFTTVQWTLNATNVQSLVDATNFTGANATTLTIGSVAAKDTGSYQLTIVNGIGTAVSSNALVVIQSPALVGEWLNGTAAATNLLDVSGYSLATNHGAFLVGAGTVSFTNDVPPGKTGVSAFFNGGGLAISNSSTLDATYDNTFDQQIANTFTIACWGRNFPAAWNPFMTKWGEGTPYNSPEGGWQLRCDGASPSYPCFTVRDGQIGGYYYGCDPGDNPATPDDMGTIEIAGADGGWHFYVGTFNANTGVRCLYVDGVLAAEETNNVACIPYPPAHVCIGAKDSPPGGSFGSTSTGIEILRRAHL